MLKNGGSKTNIVNDNNKKSSNEKNTKTKEELSKNLSQKSQKMKTKSKSKEKELNSKYISSETPNMNLNPSKNLTKAKFSKTSLSSLEYDNSNSNYYQHISNKKEANDNISQKKQNQNNNNNNIDKDSNYNITENLSNKYTENDEQHFKDDNNSNFNQRKSFKGESSNSNNNEINNNNNNNNNRKAQINKLKKMLNDKKSIDNKIEKLLSSKMVSSKLNDFSLKDKARINNKTDLVSPTSNNGNNNNINTNNINSNNINNPNNNNLNNNYLNTNPNDNNANNNINNNNSKTDIKFSFSMQKNFIEKSCPKFNINKKVTKNKDIIDENNSNNNNNNNNEIILDENSPRKTSMSILNSIRGNLAPYYYSLVHSVHNNNSNNNNEMKYQNNNNNNNNIGGASGGNMLQYLSPKDKYFNNEYKTKVATAKKHSSNNNINTNTNNNEVEENFNKRICTQTNCNTNNNNNNGSKSKKNKGTGVIINDKSIGLRKLKTINNKNEKKDLTINNISLKKRRPRRFESEINSNLFDSTNILTNNVNKNKSSYLNFNHKGINNSGMYFINVNCNNTNKNYGTNNNNNIINKKQNYNLNNNNNNNNQTKNNYSNNNNNNNILKNNIVQRSNRDSKSLTVNKNKNNLISNNNNNNNYHEDIYYNQFKKIVNINEPYINNLLKMMDEFDPNNNNSNNNYSNKVSSSKNKNNYYSVNKKKPNIINSGSQNKKNSKSKSKSSKKHNIKNENKNPNNQHNNQPNNNNSIKNEIDENKILENISQNTLLMYSIYISSSDKYYNQNDKIGLRKIKIYDNNDNEIPVICYNTNANFDNGKLFNPTMANINTANAFNSNNNDENNTNEVCFISDIKKNLHINFYFNNIKSNILKYIKIYNCKNHKDISPVKNIEIYKANLLIYKGVLNEDITYIKLSEGANIYHNNDSLNIVHERPFSTSKSRTQNNNANTFICANKNIYGGVDPKEKIDVYHTARNIVFKGYNNQNEIINYENDNENNRMSSKSNAISNNSNRNTINIHINNNTNNITNLEIFENSNKEKKKDNNNDNKDIQINSKNNSNKDIIFYTLGKDENNTNQNINNNNNINIAEISKTNEKNNNKNDQKYEENILLTSINKKRGIALEKINPHKDYNETEFNNNINNNEILEEEGILTNLNANINNINNLNSNMEMTSNNSNSKIINSKLRNSCTICNYIEFNKIRFIITSNYGHSKYVGLTGIEFYNIKGDLINIETASSIGALPKDLRTLYDDDDNRIFENIFTNFNNTNESDNMWVTKLKKSDPKTFIELFFNDKIKISKIKIYNYNERDNLNIGVKTIDLYLDDIYYNTLFIYPGTGEIAYDYIKINNNKDNNDNNDEYNEEESTSYKGDDFGQEITFPINNSHYLNNDINNINIKYASFLYEQSYETPFMPCGHIIKFELISNYYKGTVPKEEADLLKYNDIGLDMIQIFNNESVNVLNGGSDENREGKNNSKNWKYKLISNCEIFHNDNKKIIINGTQNENCNNCLFYMFDENIHISYIKFSPLTYNLVPILNSVKEIKIFCDSKIIFEGNLYYEQPTIVLFTCDMKITKNINEKYLTKKTVVRESCEQKTDNFISLILN